MIKNIFSFIFRIYFYNDYIYSIQNIMKKIWLLTTLLVAGLLLTGCNKICTDDCWSEDLENHDQIQCDNAYDPICWEDWNAYSNWWKQPQRINDFPEETGKENILVTTEEPMYVNHVINLKLWDKSFDVTLEDNTATKALLEKLKEWDIVVNAQEYWGFEKVWYLWFKLPTEDINITTQLWDLVLYDWNQISLFYNSNSWSYTKLWKVQKITESDFWDWDVTLVFSLLK